jgi:hypothetical protein
VCHEWLLLKPECGAANVMSECAANHTDQNVFLLWDWDARACSCHEVLIAMSVTDRRSNNSSCRSVSAASRAQAANCMRAYVQIVCLPGFAQTTGFGS